MCDSMRDGSCDWKELNGIDGCETERRKGERGVHVVVCGYVQGL